MEILGIGHAFPETAIDGDLLRRLQERFGEVPPDESGNSSRRSSLPAEYLIESGNENPRKAEQVTLVTPTELGYRAGTLALERAGVDPADVGLIVAGCATPYQTCPSEGQRIAGKFGHKVPAYDLTCSSVDFALHMHAVSSWKKERAPRFALCISTNLPTQRIDYRRDPAGYYLGDGAAAVLVSLTEPGRLKMVASDLRNAPLLAGSMRFDLYTHAQIDLDSVKSWMTTRLAEEAARAASVHGIDLRDVVVVGNQFGASLAEELASRIGVPNEHHWENASRVGCSLGSAPVTVLSERWDDIAEQRQILVLLAGPGMSSGYVLLSGGK